ncbi:hypothetical protein GR11A_00166 [Vibrio phage vB_VcorM_GR11A]|nr:hypothetical protein GR11A_00166 [Vibrio phage vB_VcorM_GR11A]
MKVKGNKLDIETRVRHCESILFLRDGNFELPKPNPNVGGYFVPRHCVAEFLGACQKSKGSEVQLKSDDGHTQPAILGLLNGRYVITDNTVPSECTIELGVGEEPLIYQLPFVLSHDLARYTALNSTTSTGE